ncbi:MAG: hypothetical protein KatS3mg015_0449 [Fimbriimonadales bacterium]|nr:MAG: hypothetical protein KatS3mg015_0449 [Fimbriimonadales bacterium]
MQVFVPYPDIEKSVQCLDDRRLFKQALEAIQLLGVILDLPKADGTKRTGWRNHPATLQWSRWPGALYRYTEAALREAERRGMKTDGLRTLLARIPKPRDRKLPSWWGDEKVHSSHRARLLQKDFEFYSRYKWPEAKAKDLWEREYWWAIPEGSGYRLEQRKGKR